MFVEAIVSLLANLPLLTCMGTVLLTVWYLTSWSSARGSVPPCPVRPYPILGHIPMLGDTLAKLKEWKETTGGIYSLYMGRRLSVVINDYDLMKEVFVNNADYFSDRPYRFIKNDTKFEFGILDSRGSVWKEQRGVAISILKNLGMGKNWFGDKIRQEVEVYLEELSKLNGQPTDIRSLTFAAVSNNICAILIGRRFDYKDASFQRLLDHLAKTMRSTSILVACFPWLRHLPGDLFDVKKAMDNEQAFLNLFGIKYVKEIKAKGSTEPGQNFILDYLLEEKKKKEAGRPTTLEERHLVRTLTNLFAGGTDTTNTIIQWALLFSIHYPSMQNKIYQEIVDTVGTERLPSLDDRAKMVYTNAFIVETMRLASIVPLSIPHMCAKTTTVAGYTIPEGTTILPNLTGVLHDPRTWRDPMMFRPERFIDQNNELSVPEQFIPFGIGRRLCFGEAMGKAELFLFLTGIFQRFHVMPENPDQLPSLQPVFGLTCAPNNYKIKLVQRPH